MVRLASRLGFSRLTRCAHQRGLFAGLAGALRLGSIPALLELQPDILGFRGALCEGARRTGEFDPDAMRAIRAAIPYDESTTAAPLFARQAAAP